MLIIALFCGAACSAPQNDVLRREVKFEKRSVQMNSQASKVKLADKIDPIKHFLIGFDNNYIYFGEFEDGFRIIPYNIEKEQLEEPVYENDEEVTISYSDIINNKIYICEVYFQNEISFQLKCIDYSGDEKTLLEHEVNKMPSINANDDYISINYSSEKGNQNTSFLDLIDIQTHEIRQIDQQQCTLSEEGLYKGTMIIYSGGVDEDIYYQIITLNDELLEEGGSTTIYKYSSDSKGVKKVLELPEKCQYISGNSDFLIVSEYSYDLSNLETGIIYNLDNINETIKIPDVSPGFDLRECKKLENGSIVLDNGINIYVLDTKSRNFYYTAYNDLSGEKSYSSIKVSGNSLGYIECSEGDVYFYKYAL